MPNPRPCKVANGCSTSSFCIQRAKMYPVWNCWDNKNCFEFGVASNAKPQTLHNRKGRTLSALIHTSCRLRAKVHPS
jgi:hypothetical protein